MFMVICAQIRPALYSALRCRASWSVAKQNQDGADIKR